MKNSLNKIGLLSLLLLGTATANANLVNGGTVKFTGELINAACSVSSDTENQTVILGQYRTTPLQGEKDLVTTNVPFYIKLVDCDTEVAKTASVSFFGNQDTVNNTLLAIDGGGTNQNVASGVGIEIADATGKTLTPDGSVYSEPQTLLDGNNTLHFNARYKTTGTEVQPGAADGFATFVMNYN